MNELQVFKNSEFGEVRTIIKDGEPWFVGKDVYDILEYRNGSRDINRHVDEDDKQKMMISDGNQMKETIIINESGLYSLILSSKLPTAREFKRWVTSEVLPTIRKTGGYVNNDELFIQTYLPYADEQTKLMFRTTLSTINSLNKKIEQQQPLVDFANQVSVSVNSISIGDFAKLLKDENLDIGQNRLFKWLRDNKYLRSHNTPYQTFIEREYFDVIEQTYDTAYGKKTSLKTLVTGKGQIYFTEKLRRELRE